MDFVLWFYTCADGFKNYVTASDHQWRQTFAIQCSSARSVTLCLSNGHVGHGRQYRRRARWCRIWRLVMSEWIVVLHVKLCLDFYRKEEVLSAQNIMEQYLYLKGKRMAKRRH